MNHAPRSARWSLLTTSLLAAVLLPPAAGAEIRADDDTASGAAGDASTSRAQSEFGRLTSTEVANAASLLRALGISDSEIPGFAHYLGVAVEDVYVLASDQLTGKNAARSAPLADAPIEFVGGRVRYNNAAVKSSTFVNTSSVTQQGKATAGGECVFPPIDLNSTAGKHMLTEVTEFDLLGCSRVVVTGAYDAEKSKSTESTVSAKSQGGNSPFPGINCHDGSGTNLESNAPFLFQPRTDWLPGESRRYYKQSFIDPICIAITSTSLNVSWKNQVNSSTGVTLIDRAAQPYYFVQLGENWVNKQLTLNPTTQPIDRAGTVYATLDHKRKETDFPEHLLEAAAVVGGVAGIGGILGSTALVYAACGFDVSDTQFNSWQQLGLGRNGANSALGSGSVSGGCDNLVHERVWHGSGWYAA